MLTPALFSQLMAILLQASRLGHHLNPGGSSYTWQVLSCKHFVENIKVYFMNLLLMIWEDDKFRVLPTELYIPWDLEIINILLMHALAMPHVGNLPSLTEGVTAANAMEQTFNMSKCKILYSLLHLTTHQEIWQQ